MPPRFHTFDFMIADGDETRPDKAHQVRDGLAARQIEEALRANGYTAGERAAAFASV